jgi:hypothetical protein
MVDRGIHLTGPTLDDLVDPYGPGYETEAVALLADLAIRQDAQIRRLQDRLEALVDALQYQWIATDRR